VPASTRAVRPKNTDATALPPGGHPIKIVVADGPRSVEHLGNAGRPHAVPGPIVIQIIRSLDRPVTRVLLRVAHTGNAGSVTFFGVLPPTLSTQTLKPGAKGFCLIWNKPSWL